MWDLGCIGFRTKRVGYGFRIQGLELYIQGHVSRCMQQTSDSAPQPERQKILM